jgi:hypothetical protein
VPETRAFPFPTPLAHRLIMRLGEKDGLIRNRILYKLFHIEESLESNTRAIHTQNKALVTLRAEQRIHDQALEAARAEQAKSKTAVLQKQKRVSKEEKGLELKVTHTHPLIRFFEIWF